MRDRGFERRQEMVGWLTFAVSAAIMLGIAWTIVFVIGHFVRKFW